MRPGGQRGQHGPSFWRLETMTPSPSVQPATLLTNGVKSQAKVVEEALARCQRRPKRGRVHALRVALRTLLATLELASVLQARPRKGAQRRLEKILDALSPL